jgi:hypothetical protein
MARRPITAGSTTRIDDLLPSGNHVSPAMRSLHGSSVGWKSGAHSTIVGISSDIESQNNSRQDGQAAQDEEGDGGPLYRRSTVSLRTWQKINL